MRKKKILKIIAAVFLVLLVFFGIFYLLIGRKLVAVYGDINSVKEQVNSAAAAAKSQDLNKISESLVKLKGSLLTTQKDLSYFSFAKGFPLVGPYIQDGNHFVQAGLYGVDAGEIGVKALTPYADVLGLKGQGSFTGGTTEERIKVALQTWEKVMPMVDELGAKLKLVRSEVDAVNPNRYPESLFGKPVRSQVIKARSAIDDAETLFVSYKPILTIVPYLLGQPDQKTYFLMLQNDKELRPTGGFMTAYAFVTVKQGKMEVVKSDDMYKLDAARVGVVPAPDPIRKYLPTVDGKVTTVWQMRDSNLSPDFEVSMKKFEEFYGQIPGREKYDGIMAIDTYMLVKILQILGPVNIPQYNLTLKADNDPRCNCPQVIYVLEDQISRPVGTERDQRKELLGFLLSAMKQKIMSAPKQYWQPMFATMLEAANEKHLQFYFKDQAAEDAMSKINFAGKVRQYDNDYLFIVDTNFAGAKSNLYIEERVDQDVSVSGDGTVTKKLTINYKNPQRADGFLNGEYRDWVRVYVPKGSKLLSQSGAQQAFVETEDLGKTVFEGFITCRPEGFAQVNITYTIPQKYQKGGNFPMLLQKQAGTDNFEYRIKYNGKEIKKFKLSGDSEFSLQF